MGQKIVIEPVTRIEGHAKVVVQMLIESGIEQVVLVGPDFCKVGKTKFDVFPSHLYHSYTNVFVKAGDF